MADANLNYTSWGVRASRRLHNEVRRDQTFPLGALRPHSGRGRRVNPAADYYVESGDPRFAVAQTVGRLRRNLRYGLSLPRRFHGL